MDTPTISARATTGVPVSKYNSMYCTHKIEDHGTWRKEMDEKKRIEQEGGTYFIDFTRRPNAREAGSEHKKLALSEHLQATLVTKAGLIESQFDHIWEKSEPRVVRKLNLSSTD